MPCIRGGQWNGVETWFVVSAEGNGMAWKRGSLYPRRAMRSVEWRGNVVPAFRRQMRKMGWRVVPYIREPQHVCGYITASQQIIFNVTYLFDHRGNDSDFTTRYTFCFSDYIVCVKHSDHYCVPPSLWPL